MNGHVSPRLNVRFEFAGRDGLRIIRPDGQPFLSYGELAQREEQYRRRAEEAVAEVEQLRQRLRSLGQDPICPPPTVRPALCLTGTTMRQRRGPSRRG